jgi:hypothetical protein
MRHEEAHIEIMQKDYVIDAAWHKADRNNEAGIPAFGESEPETQ